MDKENIKKDDSVVEDKRIFKVEFGDVENDLCIKLPDNDLMQMADWQYSKTFNNAITDGIIPRSALIDALRSNGINLDDIQKEADKISEDIRSYTEKLNNARANNDRKEVEELKEMIKELRDSLYSKNSIIRDYLRNSAEGKADALREDFLKANLLYWASGPNANSQYYRSVANDPKKAAVERYKKYMEDTDFNLKARLTIEFITFMNGLPSDFLNKFPENEKEKWENKDKPVEEKEDTKEEIVADKEPVKEESKKSDEQ